MATVLNVALDILLAGSLVFFILALIQLVVREENPSERLLRGMALVAGAIVALGAQAAHVGFASYTVDALSGARPGGALFKTFSVIIPGGIGAAFGWYFLHVMRRSAAKGLRLICFLGMLTIVGFVEIFAQATNVEGVQLGAAAIPNASFVAGMIIGVLVFAPEPNDTSEPRSNRWSSLGDMVRRRAPHTAARVREEDDPLSAGARTARPTNPFEDKG
jgi:hypothetical protein